MVVVDRREATSVVVLRTVLWCVGAIVGAAAAGAIVHIAFRLFLWGWKAG